ncbi:hypothetical protein [Streptomyces sp. NPDC001933]|uniref:hypothetical protein n=1 Tax=Streptomyces sp. NPDC001933 TaxID=3364626 RepID=UPI0036832EC5
MDQALAALLGAALGSAGTAGAAALTSWSTRWQARTQSAAQHQQWQRQARRDAYSTFLTDASQAREALSETWHLLRSATPDAELIEQQMHEARAGVRAIQRAGATVAVEGPEEVLDSARDVEKHLALLYASLRAYKERMARGGDIADYVQQCAQQRNHVREALEAFGAAARTALTTPAHETGGA